MLPIGEIAKPEARLWYCDRKSWDKALPRDSSSRLGKTNCKPGRDYLQTKCMQNLQKGKCTCWKLAWTLSLLSLGRNWGPVKWAPAHMRQEPSQNMRNHVWTDDDLCAITNQSVGRLFGRSCPRTNDLKNLKPLLVLVDFRLIEPSQQTNNASESSWTLRSPLGRMEPKATKSAKMYRNPQRAQSNWLIMRSKTRSSNVL